MAEGVRWSILYRSRDSKIDEEDRRRLEQEGRASPSGDGELNTTATDECGDAGELTELMRYHAGADIRHNVLRVCQSGPSFFALLQVLDPVR